MFRFNEESRTYEYNTVKRVIIDGEVNESDITYRMCCQNGHWHVSGTMANALLPRWIINGNYDPTNDEPNVLLRTDNFNVHGNHSICLNWYNNLVMPCEHGLIIVANNRLYFIHKNINNPTILTSLPIAGITNVIMHQVWNELGEPIETTITNDVLTKIENNIRSLRYDENVQSIVEHKHVLELITKNGKTFYVPFIRMIFNRLNDAGEHTYHIRLLNQFVNAN